MSLQMQLAADHVQAPDLVRENGLNLEHCCSINDGDAIRFATSFMQDCRHIIMIAVMQQPLAFEFLSDRLKEDPELANKAAHAYSTALLFGNGRLEVDDEYILAVRMAFEDACGCWRGGGPRPSPQASFSPLSPEGFAFASGGGSISASAAASISTSSTSRRPNSTPDAAAAVLHDASTEPLANSGSKRPAADITRGGTSGEDGHGAR